MAKDLNRAKTNIDNNTFLEHMMKAQNRTDAHGDSKAHVKDKSHQEKISYNRRDTNYAGFV